MPPPNPTTPPFPRAFTKLHSACTVHAGPKMAKTVPSSRKTEKLWAYSTHLFS